MLGKLARIMAVLFFVAMIAAYAFTPGKSAPAQPQGERQVEYLFA